MTIGRYGDSVLRRLYLLIFTLMKKGLLNKKRKHLRDIRLS